MQQLIVLGSGTALPDVDRENSAYIVKTAQGLLMLDCGGSPYRLMKQYNLNPLELQAIFLSHNHPDHLMGLPALLLHLWLAQYQGDLVIFGNTTTIATAKAVCEAAQLGEHAITPVWVEQSDSGGSFELPCDLGLTLEAAPTVHSRPTLALRMSDAAQHTLVYGADSGPCPALVTLAQNADTLIHECTVSEPYALHSTPEEAATTARDANVRRIILTHYSPIYTAPEANVLERVQAIFSGDVRIAHDGEIFSLA